MNSFLIGLVIVVTLLLMAGWTWFAFRVANSASLGGRIAAALTGGIVIGMARLVPLTLLTVEWTGF